LTDFFADCLTATACNSDFYNADNFDGWSIGSNIDIDATFISDTLIIALEDSLYSFGFDTTSAGLLDEFFSAPVPPAWDLSAAMFASFTYITTSSGYGFFDGWVGSPSYYDDSVTDYINFVSF
jgi:hypothetical protein